MRRKRRRNQGKGVSSPENNCYLFHCISSVLLYIYSCRCTNSSNDVITSSHSHNNDYMMGTSQQPACTLGTRPNATGNQLAVKLNGGRLGLFITSVLYNIFIIILIFSHFLFYCSDTKPGQFTPTQQQPPVDRPTSPTKSSSMTHVVAQSVAPRPTGPLLMQSESVSRGMKH